MPSSSAQRPLAPRNTGNHPEQRSGNAISATQRSASDAMLRQWRALGRAGIEAAGGLNGLVRLGEDQLYPDRRVGITDAMLRQWATLGHAGIEAAGGLNGLARRDNVSVGALRTYLRADGTLTQRGEDQLYPDRRVVITDAMLRQWATLGRAGIEAAGGLNGLARRDNVSVGALRNYLRADGTLTQRGEDQLYPDRRVGITDAMVRQWATLGRAGIETAGGLNGLAGQYGVSVATLRTYLRADGTLTQRGEDRLDPGGPVGIIDAMVRQWATLGRAGIEAAGGLNGLARQYNVSVTTLRTYLRADGTLTQRGENRLREAGTRPM
ncbi:hypothetical protein [Pandoraea horticolens]|nr:hypothetical protein [Pandoraea horticolens]